MRRRFGPDELAIANDDNPCVSGVFSHKNGRSKGKKKKPSARASAAKRAGTKKKTKKKTSKKK